ncbi:MAG: hypothetical protein KC733_05520 [Candidatus Omnitrophica bacterium]|nr:hypothetical protein [Candidatus Omnitrophota bacterium]
MISIKKKLVKIIDDQPEDSSSEEIMRELAFAVMVERGLRDLKKGDVITNEEMARRIKTWQK